MNYKIIGKYIKDLNFSIPNPKAFFLSIFLFFNASLNKIFLLRGINNKKPIASVKKPGMIKSNAAKAIEAPEIIS